MGGENMANIRVILQQEKVDRLEHEKSFLLTILRDIEDMASRGELTDQQMVASGIKQIRGQIESGEVHRKDIKPGLVRK